MIQILSFQGRPRPQGVFPSKSNRSRHNYPTSEVKPLSWYVSEKMKKRKDKSRALWSRISGKAAVLVSFTNAYCSESVSTELSVLRQDDSKWVDFSPCLSAICICTLVNLPASNLTTQAGQGTLDKHLSLEDTVLCLQINIHPTRDHVIISSKFSFSCCQDSRRVMAFGHVIILKK